MKKLWRTGVFGIWKLFQRFIFESCLQEAYTGIYDYCKDKPFHNIQRQGLDYIGSYAAPEKKFKYIILLYSHSFITLCIIYIKVSLG